MRVLVTGGAGYIGSHACKALAAQGITPIVYDNLSTGHRGAVQFGPFVRGDVADVPKLKETFDHHHIDAVMHFAASAYVGVSCTHPADYYRNNVVGTLHLLDAMRACDIHKLVFSSTCATFGVPQQKLLDETHPQHPINPYGATKHMVERILSDYANAYGLRSIALRYFNAAGADADGHLGEHHEPETHLIPLALEAAAQDTILTVYGNNYPTEDGTCIRDYVHVDDLAQAHLLALTRLDKAPDAGFEAFNLGNGRGFSVREIVECVQAITGRPLRIRTAERRAGDPAVLVADARKAKTVLHWRPRYRELSDLIGSAWAWHKREEAEAAVYAPHTSYAARAPLAL